MKFCIIYEFPAGETIVADTIITACPLGTHDHGWHHKLARACGAVVRMRPHAETPVASGYVTREQVHEHVWDRLKQHRRIHYQERGRY